jgi:hypothetical protein
MSVQKHSFLKPKTVAWLKGKGALNEAEAKELFADFDAYQQQAEKYRLALEEIRTTTKSTYEETAIERRKIAERALGYMP